MNEIDEVRYRGGVRSNFNWALCKVIGKDRESFFQGQTTNDVKNLIIGASQITSRVDHKGRIQSFFYLLKRDSDFLLLIPEELTLSTIANFQQYIVMDDVEISLIENIKIVLCMGPISIRISKELDQESIFPLDFYDGPGLVLWGDENRRKLDKFDLKEIKDHIFESIRVLSGFPKWGVDINSTTLVNESYLEKIAVNYKKGCFLGQETITKIQLNRGAAYFPVILEGNKQWTEKDLNPLLNQSFEIEDRKGGTVKAILTLDNQIYIQATLFRQFRIENKTYILCFKESGIKFSARVRYFPYFKGHGKEEKAIELYDKAMYVFTHFDDDEKAIELLKLSIDLNPSLADAYEALGVILGRNEKYEEAIKVMKMLSEIDPKSVMAHTNLSLYYMKIGKIEEAENEKAYATTKSFDYHAQQAKEKKKEQLGTKESNDEELRSEEMYLQVLEIDAEDPLANFGMGNIFSKRGNFQSAISHFQKVLIADPKYSVAYLALGKALEAVKNYIDAEVVYKKGIEIAASKGDLIPANEMQVRLENLKI